MDVLVRLDKLEDYINGKENERVQINFYDMRLNYVYFCGKWYMDYEGKLNDLWR